MAEGRHFERLYGALKDGSISRREFGLRAMAMGMSAATVAFVVNALATKGVFAQDGEAASMVGTRPEAGTENQTRGEGGELKLLLWQMTTVLNPHTSTGTKDYIAASLMIEPLLNFTQDTTLATALAAEVPTLENGGIAEDFSSVTYKLKEGVVWNDGEPFTAKDVKFTFEWVANPTNAAITFQNYANVDSVEVIDDLTAKVNFKTPTLAWYVPFVGTFGGSVLPGHVWGYDAANEEPTLSFRTSPIGTGPYKLVSFSEGVEVKYEANPLYREANKPYFATVSITGGAGTADGAARAVLQTNEADYAWNLQVAPDVVNQMLESGNGYVMATAGTSTESIYFNFTDPNAEGSTGERSSLENPHPALTDIAVRKAMNFAVDRDTIANEFYGNGQLAAWNYLVGLPAYDNGNFPYSYDPAMANQILDEAGWALDGNVRSKDGVELSFVYHTTINPVRQDTQAVVQANLAEVGIEVELKSTDATIYFDSGVGNDQNLSHFYTDLQMYTSEIPSPFPVEYLNNFYAGPDNVNVAQMSNDWSGGNSTRWVNAEYDEALDTARRSTDPEESAAAIIRCSDLLTDEAAVLPLVARASSASAIS
ncbi:MAG: peptide ABC transporter substrate-binding protein, partial [Thermomicrobiales bacterium]|nr:peptide ABC transporter substrate-binding protein [Thermomicrobiales bacterium]